MYNNKRSTRTTDTKASDIVSQWLYNNLYSKMVNGGERYLINVDRVGQYAGIDGVFTETGETVDEKCRISDIGKSNRRRIDTFAVEVGWQKRNGERVKGWGLSTYNTPTYYNLIWLRKVDVKDMKRLRPEHIREAECLFVKKEAVQTFMKDVIGYEDDIWKVVNWMWDKKIDRKYYLDKHGYPYCHLTRSWKLAECPINLVVSKDVWNRLATHIYYVYNGRYDMIK